MQRGSSEQLPPALVSDDSYYRNQPPSSEGHNVSYASYASYPTMAPNRTPESLMGFQGQPLPSAQVPSNSHYVVRGHNPAEVNIGSSGGTSFSTHTTDPFELPYYQAVAPESRTVDNTEMYHQPYLQGYGAAVTSPPSTSSASAGSGHRKPKNNASRPRKQPRHQQVFSPGSTSSTATATSNAGRSSRLRSASRTSKNTHHNPPASAEELKSRETHNQVEKQYRNRLNAHFESLLDALPETMQAGEAGDDGEPLDLTDRRVSKAEVLDMARRHIQALERECAALEGERDELRNNMTRLRWLFGRCEGADGFNERLDFPDTGPLP
ncbi:hypothetical protein F4818DRAFT_439006 [Hypoxylon cercidicola]|nr:hypothetical protein F4818DRAFT_439006 [Hypoxylon cercidicola]